MTIITVKTGGIAADAVTDAKIADDIVGTEHLTANEVDTAALKGDAVTGAELADNAVNSEHYTDGSIDTVHLADGQVTIGKLATAVLTGATDIGAAIVDADLLLIDDGAGGTLRKTTAARIKTYIGGGTNTPAFSATMSGGQTIANNTFVKVAFDTEDFDVGGCFDTTNKRFVVPSGQDGKYAIFARSAVDGIDDAEHVDIALYLNGSVVANTYYADYSPNGGRNIFVQTNKVFDLNATDYIETFLYHNEGDERSAENTRSLFYGYKLIE